MKGVSETRHYEGGKTGSFNKHAIDGREKDRVSEAPPYSRGEKKRVSPTTAYIDGEKQTFSETRVSLGGSIKLLSSGTRARKLNESGTSFCVTDKMQSQSDTRAKRTYTLPRV